MEDSKDRLGSKLQDKEKAEEDKFFAERDREALSKLRTGERPSTQAAGVKPVCPRCGTPLVWSKEYGVCVDQCPKGHGMWLDQGELEVLAERERNSWLGRYFYTPRLKD